MKEAAFQELLTSVRQAARVSAGRAKPSRVITFRPAAVNAVRAKLGQSQADFALMIGLSVATLRNWEQRLRSPDGPALASCALRRTIPAPLQRPFTGRRAARLDSPRRMTVDLWTAIDNAIADHVPRRSAHWVRRPA